MLAPPSESRSDRLRRDEAINKGLVASVGARVIAIACSLVQIPIALNWLGAGRYGLWVMLTTATALLTVMDLGLGLGMQNQTAAALSRNERARAATLFTTAVVMLAGLGAILFGAGLWVIRLAEHRELIRLTDPALADAARSGAIAALAVFCVGLPLGAAVRLANACQWGWLGAIWTAVGGAGQLAAVALAAHWQVSFSQFVWIAGLAPLAANLALLVHTTLRLGWRPRDLRFAGAPDRSTLIGSGLQFGLPQLGAVFIYNIAPPAIGAFAGPAAVASFHVLQRIFGVFSQIQQLFLGPVWPAYTDAFARGDHEWIRAAYRRTLRLTLIFVAGPLLAAGVATPMLVSLWVGPLTIPNALVWTVAAWNLLLCLGQPPANLLGGIGRVHRLAYLSMAGHAISAVLLYVCGERWGAVGVVSGLAIGYLVIGLPGTFFEAHAAMASPRSLERR